MVHFNSQNLRSLRSPDPERPVTALHNLTGLVGELQRRGIRTNAFLRIMDANLAADNSDSIIRTFGPLVWIMI